MLDHIYFPSALRCIKSTSHFHCIIGTPQPTSIRLSSADRRRIQTTSDYDKAPKVIKNLRHRLAEIMKFIKSKYPAVARRLIYKITTSDLNNPSFHWFGASEDFKYGDIHPDIIKAFLLIKN